MRLLDKHKNIRTEYNPESNDIVVRIHVETLFYAMNHRMYNPLKIHNKGDMLNYVVEWLTEWGGDAEVGSTAFEDFLDRMFDDALGGGELWLDMDEEDQ
jgi:hypothetical protein